MSRTMKSKMLVWMSEVGMNCGVDAYFFRDVKSDCNGYRLQTIDRKNVCAYNEIGL